MMVRWFSRGKLRYHTLNYSEHIWSSYIIKSFLNSFNLHVCRFLFILFHSCYVWKYTRTKIRIKLLNLRILYFVSCVLCEKGYHQWLIQTMKYGIQIKIKYFLTQVQSYQLAPINKSNRGLDVCKKIMKVILRCDS